MTELENLIKYVVNSKFELNKFLDIKSELEFLYNQFIENNIGKEIDIRISNGTLNRAVKFIEHFDVDISKNNVDLRSTNVLFGEDGSISIIISKLSDNYFYITLMHEGGIAVFNYQKDLNIENFVMFEPYT